MMENVCPESFFFDSYNLTLYFSLLLLWDDLFHSYPKEKHKSFKLEKFAVSKADFEFQRTIEDACLQAGDF